MNVLATEKQTQVISALTEGLSIRSASRMFNVERNTIGRLALRVGEGCERLHDRLMRNLQVNLIEMDEQWQFINKKAKHVQQGDPSEYGDCWLYIALAATQKAIISYTVGKRNDASTREFLSDLRQRIVNRVQITSDGYPGYPSAMEATFGHDVDFATIVKHYAVEGSGQDAAHRYSPSKVTGSERTVIRGRPAREHISTSYVERFNLSSRMQMRRFTRLTNAFSKKLANHRAAIALWVCFYNLCRVHDTLRCTPAMAIGVTDHIWSIGELIEAAQEPEEAPPLPPVERPNTLGGRTPFKPYVISGGRAAATPRRRI
jgi:IS1 family transposase